MPTSTIWIARAFSCSCFEMTLLELTGVRFAVRDRQSEYIRHLKNRHIDKTPVKINNAYTVNILYQSASANYDYRNTSVYGLRVHSIFSFREFMTWSVRPDIKHEEVVSIKNRHPPLEIM